MISKLMLSTNVLVLFLNAALTATVACGFTFAISRRESWALPIRHAILVIAMATTVVAPAVVPLLRLPAFWAVSASEAVVTQVTKEEIRRSGNQDATAIPIASRIENEIPRAGTSLNDENDVKPAAAVAERASGDPSPSISAKPERFTFNMGIQVAASILCELWIIGFMVGLAKTVFGLMRLHCWKQSSTVADSPSLAAVAKAAAIELGLTPVPPVHCSRQLLAPVTFGLLSPRIVVPADIETCQQPDQLRAVLQHEMAHILRRDLWIGLLQQSAVVIHWWNPLVHWSSNQLSNLREQICDDLALRNLQEPSTYAAALISFAERCHCSSPVPATLGIGSSSPGQLEKRILRILSSNEVRCVQLTLRSLTGVLAVTMLMTATILFAQVDIQSPPKGKQDPAPKRTDPEQPQQKLETTPVDRLDPSLTDLIRQIAFYERVNLPYDIESMETFRYPDDLTPQERARNLQADGRKHQRLMEYAELERRVWRSKETHLIDDEIQFGGPWEQFSNGERILQVSSSPQIIDGARTLEYYVNTNKNQIANYQFATPLYGVFCLSTFGASELFSKVFETDEEAVDLTWDNGDAKLTFSYGQPAWNIKLILWLSRSHDWHPIRLQRYWNETDELFFDEWEATAFVQQDKVWRVTEGTIRYRNLKGRSVVDPRIKYSTDFKILKEKYGADVDEGQFNVEVPSGVKVRNDQKPEAEPPPPAKTREITVTVSDVAGKPIPNATVRLPRWRFSDLDLVTTDEKGIARSSKAPIDDVSVEITAQGFRPIRWIIGNVNELQATMVPVAPGVALDEQGEAVADAWITNTTLQIRTDGITIVPQRDWDGKDKDWSGADGSFELKFGLTLQRRDRLVPCFAVSPSADKMALQFVPAVELGNPQKLVLQPVCRVHGHCLLKEVSELVQVGLGLETSDGKYIASVSTRRGLEPDGLRVDFEVRVPAGDYVLMGPQTSYHAGFKIPFTVPRNQSELDLGTKDILPFGAMTLKGKAAPELGVQWRPGEEMNWEKLRGKVVVLDFWGTWCGPCVNDMPLLMDLAAKFHDQPVAWLSIHTPNLKSFDELDRAIANCQEKSWNKRAFPFTAVIDHPLKDKEYVGEASERYGVVEWPTLIVVDQHGKVVGPIPKKKLADTIAGLLNH